MSSGRLSALFHGPFFQPAASHRSERDSWPATNASVADIFNLSSPHPATQTAPPLYSLRLIYWVDGRMYTGCLKTRRQYAIGDAFEIRYDPRNPERNSADPEEKLRTGLLVTAAATLAALYVIIALSS